MAIDATALELLIRGAAVGGFLGLGLCMARVEPVELRISGVLFDLTAAAHVITQHPPATAAMGPAFPVIWTFSVIGTAAFWVFATDLFSDARRPLWRRFWPVAMNLGLGLTGLLLPYPASSAVWVVYYLTGLGLMAHALWVIAQGWQDDLVETRRRLRGPVLAAGALYGVLNAIVQTSEILWRPMAFLSPVAAVALAVLSLSGIAVFLNADVRRISASPRRSPPKASAQDKVMLARLTRIMDEEEAWRTEALTMFDLARRVGAPEHRLRRLINDHLGYRNFSAFLNERRIAAAKFVLADAEHALKPVSSVAYEVGFASLGPFNRAFKANTGQTPSEWRASRQEVIPAR